MGLSAAWGVVVGACARARQPLAARCTASPPSRCGTRAALLAGCAAVFLAESELDLAMAQTFKTVMAQFSDHVQAVTVRRRQHQQQQSDGGGAQRFWQRSLDAFLCMWLRPQRRPALCLRRLSCRLACIRGACVPLPHVRAVTLALQRGGCLRWRPRIPHVQGRLHQRSRVPHHRCGARTASVSDRPSLPARRLVRRPQPLTATPRAPGGASLSTPTSSHPWSSRCSGTLACADRQTARRLSLVAPTASSLRSAACRVPALTKNFLVNEHVRPPRARRCRTYGLVR
jgi:hypothetical protein